MSHKSVRALIETTVKSIQDGLQYSYGKDTDFNQDTKRDFLMVNTEPLSQTPSYAVNGVTNYSVAWQVRMVFYKFDTEDSINYADILDETSDLVDTFLNRLNQVDTVLITGINVTSVIKVMADCLTGHLLSFTLTPNDDYNYCEDC